MDINYLDKLAKNNEKMPVTHAYAQCYFIAARALYRQYEAGLITLEQAREEKSKLREAYQLADKEMKFVIDVLNIASKLDKLKQDGFNSSLEWEILNDIERLE